MDTSIFMVKKQMPGEKELQDVLGKLYFTWNNIVDYVHLKYPAAIDDWHYPGKKYGWNFRIKDRKRAIIYLLPREGFFKAAFVFGQKAFEIIMNSKVSSQIKKDLEAARIYTEGRGIRIDIKDESTIGDIERLIDVKLGY